MKKFLIIILALGCIYLIYKQFKPKNSENKNIVDTTKVAEKTISKLEKMRPIKQDFDKILEKDGLSACYNFDAIEQENQTKIDSKKEILTAFEEGINALFVKSEQNKYADNLVSGVEDNPSAFGLQSSPTSEEIKKAITKGLKNDKDLKITLLPEKTTENSGMFPPEEGESVKDFWIWYVHCPNYFPGPIWILVKRDGTMPAYHYGKM